MSSLLNTGFLERFTRVVAEGPQAPAITVHGTGERLSFSELEEDAQRWRACLEAVGVGPGMHVLLMLPHGSAFIASFLALTALGAVVIPTSDGLTSFELEPVLMDSRASFLITSRAGHERLRELWSRHDAILRTIIITDKHVAGEGARATDGTQRVLTRGDVAAGRSALTPPDASAVIAAHFTYKGLGYPLGALHTYEAFNVCVDGLFDRFPHGARSTQLCGLPMHPVYGLVTEVLGPLVAGCHLVLIDQVHNADICSLIEEHDARFMAMVPPLFRLLLLQTASTGRRMRAGFTFGSGGSHLSTELIARVEDATGAAVYQGYGLTEAMPVSTNSPGRNRAGSLGTPLSKAIEVRVVDVDGRTVEQGRTGEIIVSGPTVMLGYLNRPSETSEFLKAGVFHTGDLGFVDEDGFLHFVARRLPFTKVNANMVDLTEVERVACSNPAVLRARAYEAHKGARQHLALDVETQPHQSLDRSEMRAWCRRKLSAHKIPTTVRIVRRPDETSP